MPGEPVPYTDIGGGGELPPHGEDYFNRIVNVHWPKKGTPSAKGVFIAISYDGTIHYLKVGSDGPTDDQTGVPLWQKVAGPFIDPNAGIELTLTGSACSPKAFVAVGSGNNADSTGVIYASGDGTSWSPVHTMVREQEGRNRGADVFAVAWDGSRFWAGAHQSLNSSDTDPRVLEYDILLTSSDGFDWSEAGRHEIVFFSGVPGSPPDVYTRGLLVDRCSPRVVDANSNSLPDGFYGYADAGLLIKPSEVPTIDYFFGVVGFIGDAGSGNVIVESTGTELLEIPANTNLSVVRCVAHGGGIWVAAGGAIAAEGGSCEAAILMPSATTQTGTAWTRTDPRGSKGIVSICGRDDAPLKLGAP